MEVKKKICSKCNQNKDIDNFYIDKRIKSSLSHVSRCKRCIKKYNKEYRKTYIDNRDRNKYKKEYYLKNISKMKNWNKEWRKLNNRSEYHRNYRNNNPSAKIACYCRNRIRNCIKKSWKSESSLSLTGCNNWKELKEYIESKFESGMNWENMGKWHIDHIRPCSSFDLTDPEQQRLCFHYSNLQPLWAKDNLSKSDKIT
jgi:hypothetical protein